MKFHRGSVQSQGVGGVNVRLHQSPQSVLWVRIQKLEWSAFDGPAGDDPCKRMVRAAAPRNIGELDLERCSISWGLASQTLENKDG